jgi:hypothetical protein
MVVSRWLDCGDRLKVLLPVAFLFLSFSFVVGLEAETRLRRITTLVFLAPAPHNPDVLSPDIRGHFI